MNTPKNKWMLAGAYALGALIVWGSLDRFLCSTGDGVSSYVAGRIKEVTFQPVILSTRQPIIPDDPVFTKRLRQTMSDLSAFQIGGDPTSAGETVRAQFLLDNGNVQKVRCFVNFNEGTLYFRASDLSVEALVQFSERNVTLPLTDKLLHAMSNVFVANGFVVTSKSYWGDLPSSSDSMWGTNPAAYWRGKEAGIK